MPLGTGQVRERRFDGRDHYIAVLVERHREDRPRLSVRNIDLINAAQPAHLPDLNVVAVSQADELRAVEFKIADAIKLGLVGDTGVAIAEADLRPQIETDLNAAVGGGAA